MHLDLHILEASKGGMKVGRIKDPLYKDSYFGITPPTFIPPFEAPEHLGCCKQGSRRGSERTLQYDSRVISVVVVRIATMAYAFCSFCSDS